MYRLSNTTQNYAWGSQRAISDLLGREPSGKPEAELWMGAHPSAPSRIGDAADAATLLDFISADPVGMLGLDLAARFHNRLPFLLKVLSAEKALSIQTHPTREQAEAGYAADNAAGLEPKAAEPQLRRRLAQARDPVRAHRVRGAGGLPRPRGRRGDAARARRRRPGRPRRLHREDPRAGVRRRRGREPAGVAGGLPGGPGRRRGRGQPPTRRWRRRRRRGRRRWTRRGAPPTTPSSASPPTSRATWAWS